jgi:hypothetical protein
MPDLFTFFILTLAVHRLTRLITTDTIFSNLREKIWNKFPPDKANLGYLITCDWCTSIWAGALIIGSYLVIPYPTVVVSLVLAISTIVGYLAARIR